MINIKALVVGTGRCGTGYAAHLLTSMGFPCGHESIFTNKGIEEAKKIIKGEINPTISQTMTERSDGWVDVLNITADSSYLSAPFLDEEILKETKVIHLIRHPLDVIGSFVLEGEYFGKKIPDHSVDFQNFIKKHLPIVYDNDYNAFDRGAIFYLEWNNLIKNKLKNKNYLTHKIEDDPKAISNFLGASNYNENISKKINSWNHSNRLRIGLEEFDKFRDEIVDFCEKYKYDYQLVFRSIL